MDKKIALFIDGGYFIRRLRFFCRKYYPSHQLAPEETVRILRRLAYLHSTHSHRELYRVYYYDAAPLDDQVREPVPREGHAQPSTRNFKRDPNVEFQNSFHQLLRSERKVALRMGTLSKTKKWLLNDDVLPRLLKKELTVDDLLPQHFHLDVQQKGVDTRLGVDVTSTTLNKFADAVVLIAGDADFVPASKFARTHGVDVVLDPLWSTQISPELLLHIDGKKSYDMVKVMRKAFNKEPELRPSWWPEPTDEPVVS